MIKYIGKVCPYCKSTFKEGDDIVVCSECEMPHHKDCWIDNKGCTTFGCQGTIQGIDFAVDTTISSAPKYDIRGTIDTPHICKACGAELMPGNGFCGKCGTPVSSLNSQISNDGIKQKGIELLNKAMSNFKTETVLDDETGMYIGSKQEYYLARFVEMKNQKNYTSWNIFSCLLGPFWFLYRKIYVFGGALLALYVIAALIGGPLALILEIVFAVASGFLGNYFYMYDIEKRVKKGKEIQGYAKNQYVDQYGDVNATAPSVAAVAYALLCVILMV